MDSRSTFTVGKWLVEPELDRISRGEHACNIRPQVMDLLEYLADRPGKVVPPAKLLRELWQGKVVTGASVYNCVAELRQALAGDDGQCYIETIPRRGYRLVAPVTGRERIRVVHSETSGLAALPAWSKTVAFFVLLGVALGAGMLALDGDRQASQQADSNVADQAPSIAVMPFRDLSPGGDQVYFSDGITEELLNALAQLEDLRVISQSSAFSLRDSGLNAREVGDRLGADYVLEGSVRRSGNRVRITAQLIDTRSDTHLWSEAYDRVLGDIFAVQDDIAARVADELTLRLRASATSVEATDPMAFDLVLKGRYEVSQRLLDNLRQAERYFEQAITIDPDYAPAHAGLAKALLLQAELHGVNPSLSRPRAKAALDRALTLDPRNSDALATKGMLVQESNPDDARTLFEQAIAHNPSNSDAYRWLALNYSFADPPRYLELMRKASLVDPRLSPLRFHLTTALHRFGRYDEALAAAREWHALNPAFAGPDAMAGRVHSGAGHLTGAFRSYYSAYRKDPGWNVPSYHIAWLLAELGEISAAQAWSQETRKNDSRDVSVAGTVQEAIIAELVGRHDTALRLLGEASKRDPNFWRELGRAWVFVGEYARARQSMERSRSGPDWGAPNAMWEGHDLVSYALALQRTGDVARAELVAGEALQLIERQRAAGMVHFGGWSNTPASLLLYAAALHAMQGDLESSLSALRRQVSRGGLSCTICLRRWAAFDALRDDPVFGALVAEQEARNLAWRRQLTAEGLLLTPREVMQLDEFTYDPFDRLQEPHRAASLND